MKVKIKYDNLFSVPEVCVILDKDVRTVREMVHERKLELGRAVSNQGAFLIRGNSLWKFIEDDPRFNWREYTFDIPEERKTEYLLATKDRCMREIRAAKNALHSNTMDLEWAMRELF